MDKSMTVANGVVMIIEQNADIDAFAADGHGLDGFTYLTVGSELIE